MVSNKTAALQLQLHISGCYGRKTEADGLILYGAVFIGERSVTAQQLAVLISDALDTNKLNDVLASLNGFFALVYQHNDTVLCVTDKVRSRPLFYALFDQQLIVADQAVVILQQYVRSAEQPSANIDNTSQIEFMHTGFVTGKQTLHANIMQLQAAELLQVNLHTAKIHRQFYYCFIPHNNSELNADIVNWQGKLDSLIKKVVQRLITYANGRQIVVPLSGGYDSRALALYLKQAGYTNVLCFTFGRPGSAEVALSYRVATELGFPWHCVTYSRRMWRQLLQQPQFNDYLRFVHGLVSVPNVQVFPAVQQLVARQLINPDAVIAPGHTSAFFSGDMDNSLAGNGNWPKQALQAVIARHYQNSRQPLPDAVLNKVQQQIAEIVAVAKRQGITNSNSVAEAWNYRERQAKFIINSNRYYDFFALDWWMPFWDSEFMAFWQQVPFNLRQNKTLWTGFVEQQMASFTGSTKPYGHAHKKKYSWLTRYYSWFNYFLDDNDLFALVPFSRWFLFKLRVSKRSGTVFGCLAEYSLHKDKILFANKTKNDFLPEK